METSILDMPFHTALEIMKEWVEKEHDGKLKLDDPLQCPVQKWIEHNNKGCGKDTVPNTMVCPVCGEPCCPKCFWHDVIQVSRVTGYLSDVSGWNASKTQEFKDRQRTDVATFA